MSTASYERGRSPESGAEYGFYGRYGWCLNPLQPLDRLLARMGNELEAYPRLELEWQREEARINLYLLSCAIGCTVADQLTPRVPSLARMGSQWPRARMVLRVADKMVLAAHHGRNWLLDGEVHEWLREWQRCVDLSCEILLHGLGASSPKVAELWGLSRELTAESLPERIRSRRMQLPSGFRAQDLTHHDAIALADGFDGSQDSRGGELAIVGARTAGAYFAPLMQARLRQRGWKSSWMSVRPKSGVSRWEKQWLRSRAARAAKVLVVDDHPDTGETIRMMIELLEECGVERWKITVVVPSHEAQRNRSVLTGGHKDVALVTLAPQEHYKNKLLAGDGLRRLLEELTGERGWVGDWIEDEATEAINRELAAHQQDDYQVHVKRVYAMRTGGRIRRVVVKSVGWGWLGYHAYLAGIRLQEFVPQVLGLRQGMLISEWIEAQERPEPSGIRVAERVAGYAAERVRLLSLAEYAPQSEMTASVTGCYALARLLRGVYPPYLRRLKMGALWRRLRAYATPQPAFIDGKLGAGEWLSDGQRVLKIDYEHHGFGNPAPNVVDAAYDLALACEEWNLSAEAEKRLLEKFTRLTGDERAGKRVALYKLVCGHQAAELARFQVGRARTQAESTKYEAAHIEACNFLTYSMARFCGEEFARRSAQAKDSQAGDLQSGPMQAGSAEWQKRLFFLDLDGCFDSAWSFFAHTTASGMAALEMLHRNGYSVVLNTGRPVAHVRQYCSAYGMAGGIAEYGCVFVDHARGRETVLIDDKSREQMAWLRARLSGMQGIYLDPTYEVAIRAYQIKNGQALCLPQELLDETLRDFPLMTALPSAVDVYFVPKTAGKGAATMRVMEELVVEREATAAMGDTESDLPMLECVGRAYVPGNASKTMADRARKRRYRVLGGQFQRGFLQAVCDLTGEAQGSQENSAGQEHILKTLLRVADQTTVEHWLGALRRDRL